MITDNAVKTFADNDTEKISSIRATVGAIHTLRMTAARLSSRAGKILLTDQDRLLFLVELAEANAKEVTQ